MSDAKHADQLVKYSRFLSMVLRHKPETIGLTLDAEGWADVDMLLAGAARSGRIISLPLLKQIVADNDKKRFSFSDDFRRIRAVQGHSVEVELGYPPAEPPPELYHGTIGDAVGQVFKDGLKPMSRQQVHLSADLDTARKVGARRGRPVILRVDSAAAAQAGILFYRSDNGVWLVDHMPAQYLSVFER
ncbi:RNA 2'-phosphotransferase [Chitinimonas lacunae]|uniref:Probable RNA 2'-phosphotransferase n=1 Tax=Chitinimonas lacunae TaxID=1963018 RepID=A0ABV8MIP3_9NEIS